jgi:hypothetical protein
MSTEAKHTPGPWKYDTIEGKDENAYTYDVILDPNGNHLIGSCREIHDDLIACNDADWPLFAAAPEMLEALEACADFLSMMDHPDSVKSELIYLIHQKAIAAIAKAKGRVE